MVQTCVLVELNHFPLPLLWGKAGPGLAGEFEIVNCLSVKNLFNLTDENIPPGACRPTKTWRPGAKLPCSGQGIRLWPKMHLNVNCTDLTDQCCALVAVTVQGR